MKKQSNPSELLGNFSNGCLKCAFSRRKFIKIGTGSTSKKQAVKEFFYIEQTDEETFESWRINENNLPSGEKDILTTEQILSEYIPEMELYSKKVRPAMSSLKSTLGRADRYRKQGNTYSAEMEYSNALALDSQCVRAVFGLGLIYLTREENDKAAEVFRSLVSMDGAYEGRHKHLFNEFGIALRKSGMYEEAVAYYARGLTLSSEDENLAFNLARAWFEKGDLHECIRFLARSLHLRKDMTEAFQFCGLL
ncbi:MAG: tetratricopeptide repeat protein, partial [Desulfovibrionales bacterium]